MVARRLVVAEDDVATGTSQESASASSSTSPSAHAELARLAEHRVDLLLRAGALRPVRLGERHREAPSVAAAARHRDRRVAGRRSRRSDRLAGRAPGRDRRAARARSSESPSPSAATASLEELDACPRRGSPVASRPPRTRSPPGRGARRRRARGRARPRRRNASIDVLGIAAAPGGVAEPEEQPRRARAGRRARARAPCGSGRRLLERQRA